MSLDVRLTHGFAGFSLDLGFEAPRGITGLFGASGAGKSTVIKAIAGLLRPQAGRVRLNGRVLTDTETGQAVPPHRRGCSVIFQEDRLFPHLSVRSNLYFATRFGGRRSDRDATAQVVDLLGLSPLLDRRTGALSGGEKQRVAIGRALIAQPQLILADEPLSSLDAARKAEILPYFERLRDVLDIPVVYVSHDPAELDRLADHVIVLRDGRIAREGLPEMVLAAAGSSLEPQAELAARIVAHHGDGTMTVMAGEALLVVPGVSGLAGHALRLRIPAQSVLISVTEPVGLVARNVLAAEIAHIKQDSRGACLITLRSAAGLLKAALPNGIAKTVALSEGQPVHAILQQVFVDPADRDGAGQGPAPVARH